MSVTKPGLPSSLFGLLRREAAEYMRPNKSDRPWQLSFAVAMASGVPMMIGAWFGNLAVASLATLGAMTIVYLPRTRLHQRMAAIMAASCAMIACFAMGQVVHMVPELRVPMITVLTLLVTVACRYYKVGPPGPLFFVMAATIGVYAPGTIEQLPEKLGLFALGTLFAVAVSFLYSLYILRRFAPLPLADPPANIFDEVMTDSVVIAIFTGLALAFAEMLAFDRPYWAPVSCIAVMQGASLRLVWNRQIQRIMGTLAGLVPSWLLFYFATSPWHFAIAVAVLVFCVETIIVRNYALATVFITPLALALAESTLASGGDATSLIFTRLVDTVLGAFLGLLGGLCIYRPEIRRRVQAILACFWPKHGKEAGGPERTDV